ncbi:hypothetical protein BGZ65_011810 [Modicella reniformis]|uniref:Secretory carrier membrane protein n=1 Tax=Modicella reniformis TaxID=1440133 RepID=A0A9P6IMP2_9FUNG|nr:hypothetical protein BGZ65_011810 [Modicella reniformis]
MSSQNPFEHAEYSQSNPFEDANQIQADVALTEHTGKAEVGQDYTSYTQYGDSQSSVFQTNDTPNATDDPKLAAKAAELRRREEELAAREREMLAAQAEADPEIPKAHQSTVKFLYNLWLALLVTLGLNFLACMLMLFAGIPTGGTDMGVALGYCFTITASSFLLWYRPIYNAFMKEMSMYYYFYFVFNGFHILFALYMALGFPSTKVRLHYNQEGHTFDEAKAQVTSSAVRSQAVQNAAWNAATRNQA